MRPQITANVITDEGVWMGSESSAKLSTNCGLAHATGVHKRNTVPNARFALKKRHGFCAKAREKNMPRHRLGTL